jgi:hypothetical protein
MQLHADVQLHWARAVHRRPAVHNRGVVMYVLHATNESYVPGRLPRHRSSIGRSTHDDCDAHTSIAVRRLVHGLAGQ